MAEFLPESNPEIPHVTESRTAFWDYFLEKQLEDEHADPRDAIDQADHDNSKNQTS